ncbi:MAG: hypothetical protein K2V38_20430, partial [Gemmataceae bacterium]|nr:hypothetical protein [Gemmataceae bacterium]
GNVRVIYTTLVKATVTNNYSVVENNAIVTKQIEQDVVQSHYFNKTLQDFNGKFTTADGTPLTAEEATDRVKAGATVLASSDGRPVSKAWLQSVKPDTVVMIADGLSNAQIQWGGNPYPNTPAPQLTLLTTTERGTVMAQTNSYTGNTYNNYYYDDVAFEGRAIRGRGGYYYGAQPMEAKIVAKPLAEVEFEAYDRSGKLVSRKEALKRLAAGGLVVVSGDTRLPDETYLKNFRDDVLVLVSAEMVIPVTPIDQTKKKLSQPGFTKRNILPVADENPGAGSTDQPPAPQPIAPPVIRQGVIKR